MYVVCEYHINSNFLAVGLRGGGAYAVAVCLATVLLHLTVVYREFCDFCHFGLFVLLFLNVKSTNDPHCWEN